ncbi:hypothetical protein G9A89_012165 [Geosiphon pyriformis]|nr:hypothetical protein G9A89_012165 [Geosiphon pyriformis]
MFPNKIEDQGNVSLSLNYPPVTHCIFDMDGLLLDTERVYSEVTAEILQRYNIEYTWELKSKIMGRRDIEAAEILIRETGADLTPQEYLKERNEKQSEKFPFCKPLPGVMRLVKHLKKHNIPMVVATSSSRKNFEIKSKNHPELFDLFQGVVCGDDPKIMNGKPAPDLFFAGRELLGNPHTNKCLVFEDAIMGVKAALNAGMHVVWVPDPHNLALHPGQNGATQTLISLENFEPILFGLPTFDDDIQEVNGQVSLE